MASKVAIICLALTFVGVTVAQDHPTFQTLPYNPNNQPHVIREPYYRPPTSNPYPQIYRARRDIGGQITTNPAGGHDALIKAQTGIGDPNKNIVGTVFAAGNTDRGPVATGAALGANLNGHGVSVSQTHIPNVMDTTNYNAKINVFDNNHGKLDANAFKTDMHLSNGFDLTKTGGNLDYTSLGGHGAKFEVSRIPELGTTYSALGKVNLWESADKATKLDWNSQFSKTQGGLFNGRQDFGTGFGLSHTFG